MTHFNIWRQQLRHDLLTFAPLAKEDRSINLIYGITAAAILWGVRDAPFNDDQKSALKEACGETNLPILLRAVGGWDAMIPLDAARSLSKRQRDSEELRQALTALMGTFIEDLFTEKMVQHQYIDISGTITGGNILIGGYQIVAGDMVIQHITSQKIRACPTAPKPPVHFAGRRDELNRLKEVLGQGQSVAITGIQGAGGIGKTALSLQLASEMGEFSAVLWASLGPNPNTGNQLIEWARHADPDFDPGQENLDILASRIQALLTNLIQEVCPGRVLVILDDIWEGDSVRAARTLQKAAPLNSVSLITTRSQLVVAQLRSTRLELQPMTPTDALQMLRNLLSDYRDIPDAKLLELAEVVGYHPLAMELAAGQVSLLERPAKEITEQIERYRGGIPEGSPFRDIGLELGEDREDNLEVVLAFSYKSLSATEQSHFRSLGVLAYNAPFDREICRAIWEYDDCKFALEQLRHRALLGIAEAEGWYQQHVILRKYALILSLQLNEYDIIFDRYADFLTVLAHGYSNLPPEQWNALDSYFVHIRAVGNKLSEAFVSKPTQSTDHANLMRSHNFAINTCQLLRRRKEIEQLNWLKMGLITSQILKERRNEGMFSLLIGNTYEKTGRYQEALENYEMVLDLGVNEDDFAVMFSAVNAIGLYYDKLGYKHRAIAYYEKLLSLLGSQKTEVLKATILNNLGGAYTDIKEYKKALECHSIALSIRRNFDNKWELATSLNNIGNVYSRVGQKNEAIEYLEEALHLRQVVGDLYGEATTLTNLGGVYSTVGMKNLALSYYEDALKVFVKVGDLRGESIVCFNVGMIHDKLGNLDQAIEYITHSIKIGEKIGLDGLENDRKTLESLISERDGNIVQTEQSSEIDEDFMQMLVVQYQRHGSQYVSVVLKMAGFSNKRIENLLMTIRNLD